MIQFVRVTLGISIVLVQSVLAEQTIDSASGLVIDEGYKAVAQHCSTCHSLKIVIENKANSQGWLDTIRWMQKKQGMASLNKQSEQEIAMYLAKNYAPDKKGRRTPLVIKKWIK